MIEDLCFVMVPEYAVGGALIFSLISMTMLGEVQSTRTVPFFIKSKLPEELAHALHQEKMLKGKNKQDVVAEALELYFDQARLRKG